MPAPIPFIVGCGRSGTTLLRSMLDSHPELAIPGENDLLLRQLKTATPFSRGAPISRGELDALVQASPATRSWVEPFSATQPRRPLTLTEWFQQSYQQYAGQLGKTRFGDKTPGLVLHMESIAARFPDAVFIHLVRDGRDVAQAFLDHDWGPRTIEQAATMWRTHVTAGRATGLALPRARYFELRYEDLVADPKPAIEAICAFISLTYAPQMLDYHDSAKRAQEYSPFPESHGNLSRGVTADLRNWRVDMSVSRRLQFEMHAGATLEMCGYGIGLPQRAARSLAARTLRFRRSARHRTRPERVDTIDPSGR